MSSASKSMKSTVNTPKMDKKYVLVEEDSDPVTVAPGGLSTDQKADSKVATKEEVVMKLGKTRVRLRGGNKARGAIVKARLYVKQIVSPGANTALASSYALTPSAATEFSSFQGLFDEVKVDAIDIHHCCHIGYAGAYVFITGMAAIGYDSTYNTTPTSAAEVLECQQSQLFSIAGNNGGVSNNAIVPLATTSNGLHKFSIRIPKGPVANASAVTGGDGLIANFPGQWMRIGDTADSVGYRRVYFPAQGTANTIDYEEMIVYHCSFRERT
jgi:hypothetical protein